MPGVEDDDLMICDGVAYQRDMTVRANYDEAYYDKCKSYEGQQIAERLNAGRVEFVKRWVGGNRVCDVGIGSGDFIKHRPNTYGLDVNPVAIEWLKRNDLWFESFAWFSIYTFWDVIEHCPEPESYLRHVPIGGLAFFSLPVFDDLTKVRESKHYRPGEHLYYWTAQGFVSWMAQHGFLMLEDSDFETRAGRDGIHSFAMKRIGWR